MISNRPYATPPIYVPMHSAQKDNLHSSWLNYFDSLTQQLNQTLTSTGNVMPSVSTDEATTVESLSTQKIIYNSDLDAFQGNINGAWETFTTIPVLSNSEIGTFAGIHPDRVQFLYDSDNDELYVVKGTVKFQLQKI